ncbi:MAG TPA: sugar-transfer associated ATP-grasp domain-containing protein [Gammaproteobacteria bacterium]
MFARIASRLTRIREAARYRSVPGQLIDLVTHKMKLNLAPYDYYAFEFYKGGKTWDEKSRYVGKHGSAYWPYEMNALRYNLLFTHKYIEKLMLKGAGLPTAQLLALVGENGDVRTEPQLRELLKSLPHDVVVKPVSGTHGRNVLVLSRSGAELRAGGKACSVHDVWQHVRSDLARGFLIEEKLTNAPEISALYPASLNTFRIVTIKTLDKRWCVAAAYLRVGAGGGVVDNIAAGGILVQVDADGCTRAAHRDGQSITHHPDTGALLVGVQLHGYRAACDLALEASRRLGFVGTIGWDIAATARGPVVVEANLWWTPSFQAALGGVITDELAPSLNKRTPFMRWDKSMMYPRFDWRRRH